MALEEVGRLRQQPNEWRQPLLLTHLATNTPSRFPNIAKPRSLHAPLTGSGERMRALLTLTLSLTVVGCAGGAQFVLKSPIQDQCTTAGLNGCPEIAEGATLYADGKAPEGEKKLEQGLAANAEKAAELKQFADGLALVGHIPGAGQYVAPLQPAILLVQKVATAAAEQQAQKKQLAALSENAQADAPNAIGPQDGSARASSRPSVVVASPVEPPPPPVATFWLVENNVLASPCRFAGLPQMRCIHESVEEAKVITDVMISSGCPVDVMIASRAGLNFDWLVYAAAGKGAEVHAASLPLEAKRSISVAVSQLSTKGDAPTLDVRCGVTTVWHSAPKTSGAGSNPWGSGF